MQEEHMSVSGLGRAIPANKLVSVSEIVIVFAVALAVIIGANKTFGDSLLIHVGSIWIANLLMLVIVHQGLSMRQQDWGHLGLCFQIGSRSSIVRAILQSLLVCVIAVAAFLAGAVVMAIISGMPERADMSRYNYLQGNLPLTILALASVYGVSSFCEEVIYRGFLITRIAELGGGGKAAHGLAVVASSLVFGLVHSDWGIAGMVQATLMGLALGVSYLLVRRNLWVMILAHGYMDTLLILQMYFGTG